MVRMLCALVLLGGCQVGDEPPLFDGITKVEVVKVGSGGLTRKEVGPDLLGKVNGCLQRSTKEITSDKASEDLLASTYLIEINDAHGARSFELYTPTNLKGNRGKYYENKCIFDLVTRLGI
jgi:hypothetical protein